MYGLRISAVFSTSCTRRICKYHQYFESNGDFAQANTHLDRPETGTVPGSHVLVEGGDGIGTGQITDFLVHVVCPGARVVSHPDTKVLHLVGLLLRDLIICVIFSILQLARK